MFFRLIATLVDDDEGVRKLGEFCVVNLLRTKNSAIFSTHFIEAIFHFNGVMHHPIYNRFPQSETDLKIFSLADDKSESKRKHLFQKMLESLSDFEKLQLAQRLCQDVLLSVAENKMSLDKGMENVLRDALWILASDGIKLRTRVAAEDDAVDPTTVPNGAKTAAAAKANLITKVVKKHVIENIMPIVIALKAHLERIRSPIMKNLMLYLQSLVHDYKNEVEDIFAADKQLGNEIMYDIRKFEDENQAQTQVAAQIMSPAAKALTPSAKLTPKKTPMASNSPSVFASTSKRGSPAFTAPRLRDQMTDRQQGSKPMNSRLSALRTVNGSRRSPLVANRDTPKDKTTVSQKPNLSWVRTPSNKKATLDSGDSSVIKLMTPGGSEQVRTQLWSVKPSTKEGTPVASAEKRVRGTVAEDIENAATDTNVLPDESRRVMPRRSRNTSS